MADTTIRAIIKLLIEGGHIPKEVAKGLTDVGEKGRKTQQDLSGVGRAAKELNGLLKQYLGAAAVGTLLKTSVTEFAALDRQWNALAFTAKRVGAGTAEDLGRARSALEALAVSGGPLQSQTLPTLQKFITMTRDVDKALAAVKLASDVSESGITDFGSAAAGMAALLQGKVKVAATQFGLDLTDTSGKAKTNAALIQEIAKTYGGLGDAFNDAANDLDATNARWEQAKQIIGKGLAPALRALPDILFHAIGAFKDLGEVAGLIANGIVAVFRITGRNLAATFDIKTLLTDPGKYVEGLKQTFSANVGDMKDVWSVFTDGLAANHTKAAETVADNTKGLAALIKQATKATAEDDAKAAAEAAQKRLDVEHKATQDVLQAQIAAAKEGSDERLALELALLDDQEKAAIDAAQRAGASVEAIREGFQKQRDAKETAYRTARAAADFDAESQRLRAEADLLTEGSDERLAAELVLLDREKQAQLQSYQGTVAGRRAIEAAYQATRIALIDQYDRDRAQRELDRYRAQLEAQGELDAAARDLELESAMQGEADLFTVRQERLQAEYDFQLQMLALQEEADIQAAIQRGDSVTGIEDQYHKKRLAAEKRFLLAKKGLDRDEVQSKREAGMAIAEASIGFARAAFGETKAVKIAEAVMNTASAVMEIWSKWAAFPPVAAALTALAVATGVAQIAKIRSAKPEGGGRGFDDPVHDQMAYLGGKKWAKDWIAFTGAGFGDTIRTAMQERSAGPTAPAEAAAVVPASPTDSAPRDGGLTVIVEGSIYGGDEGMRQLGREIDRARRRDSNRTVS